MSCEVLNAEYITGSDHKIVQAKFITGFSQKRRTTACSKRIKGKKHILEIEKATEENWNLYKLKLNRRLKKKLDINLEIEAEVCSEKKSIDELWDIIAGCILKSAYEGLPSKTVGIGAGPRRELSTSDLVIKELRALGKMCHKCAENEGKHIEKEEKERWNIRIRELNNKLNLTIEELTEEH